MGEQRLAHVALWANVMFAAQDRGSWDTGSFGETLPFSSVLNCVLLQSCEVNKTFSAPHTLKLRLPRVYTLMLGQVLALLEALVTVGTLERFLPGVNTAVALQLGGVPEALFTVGTFQWLLAGWVAAVLDELGGWHKALVTQGAFQWLLCAVSVLVALQCWILFVTFAAHITLVGLLYFTTTFVPKQFSWLAERLLAWRTFKQTFHTMHLLVVKQVGRLKKSFITKVTLEWAISWIFMSTTVAYESVLLLEAHLALLTLERSLFWVGAFMLPQVRRALETLSTWTTAEGPFTFWLALVVQELWRLLKVHFTQIALKKVLAWMSVHVPHKMRAVLKAFLAHSTLIWPLRTVCTLVVRQMWRLTEAFITCVTFVWLFTCVYSFVAGQLWQMPEGLMAHWALIWPVWCRGLKTRWGRGTDRCTATRCLTSGGLLGVGSWRGWGDISRSWPVGFLTDGALHWVVSIAMRVVMLGQWGEQWKAHLANTTHKRLLLHLYTLMLQKVCSLAEDLHTLCALERSVLSHHALVLMRVCQVRYVMATGSTLMSSLAPYLQRGLLGLHNVLLAMLGLLQGGIWLQDNSIYSTAQRVVTTLGECVHYSRWSHCMLLPRLRHPST